MHESSLKIIYFKKYRINGDKLHNFDLYPSAITTKCALSQSLTNFPQRIPLGTFCQK